MAEIIIQPSDKDTWLNEGIPTGNNGNATSLYLVNQGSNNNRRILLEFDITDYDIIDSINSATLYLYYYNEAGSSSGQTVWAYKLTRTNWEHLQAAWNIYKTGSNWTAPGGDYVTTSPAGGSAVMPGATGVWIEFNVLAILQDALAGGVAEFLVKFENEAVGAGYGFPFFYSREFATEALRPKLVLDVTYSPPHPPADVAATKGDHTDKVVVTWTKSNHAVDYQVYKDGVAQGWLGDVATCDDDVALSPGSTVATKCRYSGLVGLSLEDTEDSDTPRVYKVKARDAEDQESDYSDTDVGYREKIAPVYQWQRSAADSDADYSNITGAIASTCNDINAPAYPARRYYRCHLTLGGGAPQYSVVDRGYRRREDAPRNTITLIIRNPDGETLAYIKDAYGIGYDYRVNELGTCEFNVPADSPACEYLVYTNEVYLYINGILQDIFKLFKVRKIRSKPLGETIAVTCKQVGYTLTKDIIPSYSRAEGDENTTSEILQDFIDCQEVERVTLGGVSPKLDAVIAVEISGKNIWEACKVVRDTVGGYLSVDIDPDDPSDRQLWLRASIGENKGQQVRIGKNLTGIEHETDYIEFCNRLYPIGSAGLLLSTKEYTRQDAIKSSDASYGYLELFGLYSAYKDWTGEGDALPGNITIEKPTGAWESPTGDQSSSQWSNPQYAYDDNDATDARYYNWFKQTWTPWLTLTHAGIDATQIKWWNQMAFELYSYLGAITQIDIYYGGAWHNVFNGIYSDTAEWATVSFAQQTITGVRIRCYNSQYMGLPYPQNPSCGIKEIYIWDVTGWTDDTSNWGQGKNEKTVRCDIGDYDADAPYVISYTHAAYLIALDDIAARPDIQSGKEHFAVSDVDALLALGRTELTARKEPLKSIDAGLIDLSTEEGRGFEELGLGDMITVIDGGLDISEEVHVVRVKKPDLDIPQEIIIEIANKTKDIIDVI